MKQIKHDNILPFYGVSTTVADFCLVFPWYENGNIVDYLKKKPNINQFNLVSMSKTTRLLTLTRTHEQLADTAKGLHFLHENSLVHGALTPVCEALFLLTKLNATNRAAY